MIRRLPAEIVASLLAATTVIIFCFLLCDLVRRLRTSAPQLVRGLDRGRADERRGSVLRVALRKAQRDAKEGRTPEFLN